MREEYPRPQFEREEWLCLNGTWEFDFDDENRAGAEHWESGGHVLGRQIEVPFCFESRLSGIQDTSFHDRIFYRRRFEIPESWKGRRILLHFEAVDYRCRVFVNGRLCAEHTGGNVGFSADITDFLQEGMQTVAVAVYDPGRDETIPRGKQFWEEKSAGIWYTRTSGIWQSVWLEPVSPAHIEHVKYTPDLDADCLELEVELSQGGPELCLEVQISFQGEEVCRDRYPVLGRQVLRRRIDLAGEQIFHSAPGRCWTPEHPVLYDVTLRLLAGGKETDRLKSYFGMRKIHTKDGVTYLNNRPYYFKLVLDQGYWPDGILTAPSDQDFVQDIRLMKEMGFNGCRKHQKVEDARFLYHADHMGLLVWGEMAAPTVFTDRGAAAYTREWLEILRRDYDHPCIVAWVPFNESWMIPQVDRDVRQQNYNLGMYHLLKGLDPTRLIVGNDGWEMTKSDICGIHDYSHGSTLEPDKQEFFSRSLRDKELLLSPAHGGKPVYAQGFSYDGAPILITECGGIRYAAAARGTWGYTSAGNEKDFLRQYEHVISSILKSDLVYGFCYTQLTDVEQETNGLLTFDRKPKCAPEKIREINGRYRNSTVAR